MRSTQRVVRVFGAAIAAVATASADAAPMSVVLTGEVYKVVAGNDPAPPGFPIAVGDPVAVTVIVDPATPDLDPGDSSRGLYAAISTQLELGSFAYTTATGAGLEFVDNGVFPQGSPRDGVAVTVDTDGSDPALGAPAAAAQLDGKYDLMIMDEAIVQFVLPPSTFSGDALDLGLIESFAGVLPPGNQQHVCFVHGDEVVDVRFRLTALATAPIPEPGSAVLALAAWAAAVGRRRR